MLMTFKYRLFPTARQRTALNHTLDLCRQTYNAILALRKSAWEERRERLSLYDTNQWLASQKRIDPRLCEVHSQVLQNVALRVDLALKAFFRRVQAGDKPGYPRFRGQGWYDSFTYPQSGFNVEGDRLRLSKIGTIKLRLHRPIPDGAGVNPSTGVKTLTIRRDRLGNWYACFACEVDPEPLPPSGERVGVDLGLTTFAVLSNGQTLPRQRWLARDARDIARLQRQKERQPIGSRARQRAIRALQHAYARAARRRGEFAHQESRRLINQFDLIVFEDLDIRDMQISGIRAIRKGITDVAWGRFLQFTAYKAESAGRCVVRIDPRGTSQQCSACGEIAPKVLSVRVHSCPRCGLTINRDLNAARNILARGLASLPVHPGAGAVRDRSSTACCGE